MKKIIIVLMVLFTLSIAGGLYNTLAQLDNVEAETQATHNMNPFPYEMPDVIMHPMPGVSLY